MDVGFYILVPRIPCFDGFNYKLNAFVWGGVTYPQVPGSYVCGKHVEFVEADVTDFLLRILPEGSVSRDWRALCLKGRALDLLQMEVNGLEVDWEGNSLDQALRQILMHSVQWAVIFAVHNDQIDRIYRISVEQCVTQVRQNLRREAKVEGFAALPPKS